MKVAMFAPNLTRNSGGAETYALAIAKVLSEQHEITFYTYANSQKEFDISKIYQRYDSENYPTKYVRFIFTGGHQYLKEVGYLQLKPMLKEISREFDLFINCTHGRLPAPKGVKSIHIIHFPDWAQTNFFPGIIGTKMKNDYLQSYDLFLCNSEFTNEHFYKRWGIHGQVLYPAIDMAPVQEEELKAKENIILTVDRFNPEKRVREMMEAFIRFKKADKAGYKMICLGNYDSKWKSYYDELTQLAKKNDIEIRTSVPYAEMVQCYKKAKIFWHAMGYGFDEEKNPADMEHFGMTTVEAMANGAIPVVIGRGGQKEIVTPGKTGYLWQSLDELISYTTELTQDEKKLTEMRRPAIESAGKYLMPAFRENLYTYVNSLFEGKQE